MIIVTGKYTTAHIMTDVVEPDVIKQVNFLCNHPLFENKKIVLQADCHPSKATCVGLCAEIDTQHIIPQLLGNDIYCTISAFEIKGKENDWNKLDKVIKNLKIKPPKDVVSYIEALCNKHNLYEKAYINSFGTLGGGNHFCSIEQGTTGTYLIIHSGSRNLGKAIALIYSKKALKENPYKFGEEKQLSWLSPESSIQYQDDMLTLFYWVKQSQNALAEAICKEMKWKIQNIISCPHNYIDLTNKILHKGSIKLAAGDKGIIPINMADGTFLVFGTNTEPLLYSAPHGAGRILKRSDAKEQLNMKEYKERMKGIHSSGVNASTIDESPMAYKPIEEIKQAIEPYCLIMDHLKPLYNYKQ